MHVKNSLITTPKNVTVFFSSIKTPSISILPALPIITLDPLKLIKCVFSQFKDNLLLLNQEDILVIRCSKYQKVISYSQFENMTVVSSAKRINFGKDDELTISFTYN